MALLSKYCANVVSDNKLVLYDLGKIKNLSF
jgi:hypothetical protein